LIQRFCFLEIENETRKPSIAGRLGRHRCAGRLREESFVVQRVGDGS